MKASAGNRILMLVENNSYPQDPRVRQEATALTAAGYQVTVICPQRRGQPWQAVHDGVSVYRFLAPLEANGFLGYIWEYGYSTLAMFLLSIFVFFRRGFDVIHTHNPPDTLVLIVACYKLLGKRFIYDHHDLAPEMYQALFDDSNKVLHKLLIYFEKFSCQLADHIIATNESYKAVEMERGKVPAERITIVRNGPDLNRLKLEEPKAELRRPGKATLCYVGVMGFHDGVDYLLRALKHLLDDLGRDDFFCILVGGGNAWSTMKSLSKELDLTDYVFFTGPVGHSEVAHYLSSADICVAPEPSNTYNDRSTMIKITEYMALGKPIVAFDLPEHRFTAQGAAAYAQPNNELDFAKQISTLIDNPEQGQKLGKIGRKRIETELAWPYQVQRLLEAYGTLGLSVKSSISVDERSL